MASKKDKSMFFGVGSTPIMMTFIILCLTTFALLTLVSARANVANAKKYNEQIQLYYEADNEAILIVNDLKYLIDNNGDVLAYLSDNNLNINDNIIEYNITVNDYSYLKVQLLYNVEENAIDIVTWKQIIEFGGDYDTPGFVF